MKKINYIYLVTYILIVLMQLIILFACSEKSDNAVDNGKNHKGPNYTEPTITIGEIHNEVVTLYGEEYDYYSPKNFISNDTLYLTIGASNKIRDAINQYLIENNYDVEDIEEGFIMLDSMVNNMDLFREIDDTLYIIGALEEPDIFWNKFYSFASLIGIHPLTLTLINPSITIAKNFDSAAIFVDSVMSIVVPPGSPQEVYDQINLYKDLVVNSHYLWYIEESKILAKKPNIQDIAALKRKIRQWCQDHAPKDRGSYVIAADAAGALIGRIAGPVGSIICGAYASIYVNETFAK